MKQATTQKDGLRELVPKQAKVYYCLECGKCTSICPVAKGMEHSPRRIIKSVLEGIDKEVIHGKEIWSCLTCKLCSTICPSTVDYIELIKTVRQRAYGDVGIGVECSQGGQLHTLVRMMTNPRLKQNRMAWLEDDMKTADKKGDVLYFTGCLPYFDQVFDELEPNTVNIAKATVRILNAAGIKPVVLKNERCCGHDALWTGDYGTFHKLAEINMTEIEKTGASTVVTSCAECYRTLKTEYMQTFKSTLRIVHIAEFANELVSHGKLKPAKLDRKVTYHDPCRLGRHMGQYDEPRAMVRQYAGLVEMGHVCENALCCAVAVWLNCGALAKEMQVSRLKEAEAAGADTIITCCPKCRIHLKCALKDLEKTDKGSTPRVQIADLTELISCGLKERGDGR